MGGSYTFDGGDILVANVGESLEPFTFACWFRPTVQGASLMYHEETSATYAIGHDSTQVRSFYRDSGGGLWNVVSEPAVLNEWTHVAAAWAHPEMQVLMVNGRITQGKGRQESSASVNNPDIYIGGRGSTNDNGFTGQIARVALWQNHAFGGDLYQDDVYVNDPSRPTSHQMIQMWHGVPPDQLAIPPDHYWPLDDTNGLDATIGTVDLSIHFGSGVTFSSEEPPLVSQWPDPNDTGDTGGSPGGFIKSVM